LAKNLKLNIKNAQIAEAINLSGLKSKLAKKKEETAATAKAPVVKTPSPKNLKTEGEETQREDSPRIRARSKSAFAEPHIESSTKTTPESIDPSLQKEEEKIVLKNDSPSITENDPTFSPEVEKKKEIEIKNLDTGTIKTAQKSLLPQQEVKSTSVEPKESQTKLGPTGRHINDYLTVKPTPPALPSVVSNQTKEKEEKSVVLIQQDLTLKAKSKPKTAEEEKKEEESNRKGIKPTKFKDFKDIKTPRRQDNTKQFDARDRRGLRTNEDENQWRKRRGKRIQIQEDTTIRPTSLSIRVPITIKDLASEMKLKASQLISKLFLQGILVTLNDALEDETTLQLLGQEFGCEIHIDTTEEKRIQITDKSIKEELQQTASELLEVRPPVVVFMGHVDHGKTSLIDAIRKTNRAAGEAGAITQHIGAFRCHTAVGDIAILDTPGHEAFSAMRARGADVTDIVVLVVAGDEGLKLQTIEAIQHAKAANVIIIVAINKVDKPNFNVETVYRQLAEQELLPEAWGGQTITINCSAVTGEGIPELLEMLALQAEVLELRANPSTRARGTVLESEMHKGMGSVATVLIQNGTLRLGDAVVFGQLWGRIKTMHNEYGKELAEATPSTPVEITGLSGLPEAGQEFIVVKSEREAREISAVRSEGFRQSNLLLQQKKKSSMEHLFQTASAGAGKKNLNLVLRADVQGSLEALKAALLKIESDKADLNIIFTGVGEVSESDIQLAAASKAVVLGFHTQIENHAEALVKQMGVQVRLHNIIYHAVDDIKVLMTGLLEKLSQEVEKGKALVKATFKSSQTGIIAGCQVIEGTIHRNHYARIKRGQEVVWKGTIASLKRVKEDVREVQKGVECGILLNNFSDILENDVIEAYEIIYISQEL
jgi:translation initiation factor IF-2